MTGAVHGAEAGAWLVGKLIYSGEALASGYYSRHPEKIQYNKDTIKDKN